MTSIADTLVEKRGGVPTYVWLLGGVGVLVIIMFLRTQSQAKAQQAAAQNAVNPALQTNVLSPTAAAALSQGAAPMGYTGGNIYNNVSTTATGGSAPPPRAAPTPRDRYSGEPGFFYKSGDPQIYATVTDSNGNTYSFDPLSVNGQWVDWDTFASQAIPSLKSMGYIVSPPTGDFSVGGGFTREMGVQGQNWFNGHSVDANGNVLNTPSPQPVPVTSSWLGQTTTPHTTPPYNSP